MPKDQQPTPLDRVYKYLVGKNLVKSKKEFAEAIGYNRVYVSEVLNSQKPITQPIAQILLDKFSINMEWSLSNGKEGPMVMNDSETLYATKSTLDALEEAKALRFAAKIILKRADELDGGEDANAIKKEAKKAPRKKK